MPKPRIVNKDLIELSNHLDPKVLLGSVRTSFHDFPDPRRAGSVIYPAWYLLFVSLCAFLSGCNTVSEIASFALLRADWLTTVLDIPLKIPGYDTLWTFLHRTRPEGLKVVIREWFQSLPIDLRDKLLAIDGKRLKGVSTNEVATHLVELFAAEERLVICQEKVPDKKNELGALPALLGSVSIEGSIVSMDAMYTQKSVTTTILQKKADYLMGLKGNQGNLLDEVTNFFDQANAISFEGLENDFFESSEKGHGREESRRVRVVHDLEWLPQLDDWDGLKTIIEVVSKRQTRDKEEVSTRFYISSRIANAEHFSKWIRAHWSIENNLHWVADVVFMEDKAKNKKGHSAENMALLRRLAMNAVNYCDPGNGLAAARTFAKLAPEYLEGLLAKLFLRL
jgi:predicted transposase YbfD/YdcC